MNLQEIRAQLIRETGRNDLVSDIGANAGIDYYINTGQRLLDNMVEGSQSLARHAVALEMGAFSLSFANCRAVKEVWLVSESSSRVRLEKKELSDLRSTFGNIYGSVSSGLHPPLYNYSTNLNGTSDTDSWWRREWWDRGRGYYAIATVRVSPQIANPPLASYKADSAIAAALDGAMIGEIGTYKSIIIAPPLAEARIVEVVGTFFSPSLVRDYDTSFWSETYPDVLISAARLCLEDSYRNTEGVRDILFTLRLKLQGIDFNNVDEEITDALAIEG